MIIGITGIKQAGKDTLANYLVRTRGGQVYSLAKPIKHMLSATFNIPPEQWEDGEWKERRGAIHAAPNRTPRQLAQTLGTEWGRCCVDPDIWVNMMEYEYLEHDPTLFFVVSDVRFDNEARKIRKLGGLVVSVIRPEFFPSRSPDFHVSESGIQDRTLIDYYIYNDGPKSRMYDQLDWIVSDHYK